MPLYVYLCKTCNVGFEQITSSTDPDQGRCPQCQGKNTEKQITAFKVGGRGDLRESTMHGCHEATVTPGSSGGGHVHGGGCKH